jgi:hypothetical protein
MRKRTILLTISLLFAVILGLVFANNLWWRTAQYSIMENGVVVQDARTFSTQEMVYVQLRNWQYEAYIIDFKDKDAARLDSSRFVIFGPAIIGERMPPDGIGFGKLEREHPRFNGNSVAFFSDNGEQISVSRVTHP